MQERHSQSGPCAPGHATHSPDTGHIKAQAHTHAHAHSCTLTHTEQIIKQIDCTAQRRRLGDAWIHRFLFFGDGREAVGLFWPSREVGSRRGGGSFWKTVQKLKRCLCVYEPESVQIHDDVHFFSPHKKKLNIGHFCKNLKFCSSFFKKYLCLRIF